MLSLHSNEVVICALGVYKRCVKVCEVTLCKEVPDNYMKRNLDRAKHKFDKVTNL